MQPKVSELVYYIKNPTWISINNAADKALNGKNSVYSEEGKKHFQEDGKAPLALRKELEAS